MKDALSRLTPKPEASSPSLRSATFGSPTAIRLVTCTNALDTELTLNKTYTILKIQTEEKSNSYLISNDLGEEKSYSSKNFRLILEPDRLGRL